MKARNMVCQLRPFVPCLNAFAPCSRLNCEQPHFQLGKWLMARDLAILGRVYNNGWSTQPRGIEVAEQTIKTPDAPEVCAPKTPLTYRNIDVYRIDASEGFDLSTWSGIGGTAYKVRPSVESCRRRNPAARFTSYSWRRQRDPLLNRTAQAHPASPPHTDLLGGK